MDVRQVFRRCFLPGLIFILFFMLFTHGSAMVGTDWTMTYNSKVGVEISHKQELVVSNGYCFWGANWAWAGETFQTGTGSITDPGGLTFTGSVPDLGLTFNGNIKKTADNQLTYTYNMTAAEDRSPVIGGGMEFSIKKSAYSFDATPPDPVLLPDKTGWQWEVSPGMFVKAEFSPVMADVYFEVGDTGRPRAFFIKDSITAGNYSWTMQVTLPSGGTIVPSLDEKYGPEDTPNWYTSGLDLSDAPVDLSFLNHKPAGQYGYVVAQGDRLVFSNTGQPAKFWGANLQAYALFTTADAEIPIQAQRIAKLGHNLIRIHHHDSGWVDPNIFDKSASTTQVLLASSLDKLDRWIKALKDEGVYVWLDLNVGREFKAGDNIPGYSELQEYNIKGQGFCYLNTRIQELLDDFAYKYLTHNNPYTGLAYKDDPAVMGLLITNENDLCEHFGNIFAGDKNVPYHQSIFDTEAQNFAAATGLNYTEIKQTWVPGASKIFMADLEHRFNVNRLNYLQSSLGVNVPVATTNYWGDESLYCIRSLTDGGIIDVHAYGGGEATSANSRYVANFLDWLGSGQVYNKPYAATEWNMGDWQVRDRFTSPIYVASIAALQGWDAPMLYGYSQTGLPGSVDGGTSQWSSYDDPAIYGVMPVAALLFRRDVNEAQNKYVLKLDRQNAYFTGNNPNRCATIRTLMEKSKLSLMFADIPELNWDAEDTLDPGVTVLSDVNNDYIPVGQDYVESDTGEIRRNWSTGIQTVDTVRSQVASGWLGLTDGTVINLSSVSFEITTNKAVVAVSSLTDSSIQDSNNLLITAIARCKTIGGNKPFYSEPVHGDVVITSNVVGMTLKALDSNGNIIDTYSVPYSSGKYTITLPQASGTHWFVLSGDGIIPTPTPSVSPTPTNTPTPSPSASSGNGTGLAGEYYDNMDFTSLKVTRT
ncbi:MAG: hypothetical protein ACM3WV_07360, partial [Bacillota bacterium]